VYQNFFPFRKHTLIIMNKHQWWIKRFQPRRRYVYLSTYVYIFNLMSQKAIQLFRWIYFKDNYSSVLCGNNFKHIKPFPCKEMCLMYTHSQYQYSHYIVSVWNNHCKLHSSTIRVYLMEVISITSNVLHEKKLNLIYTRIQYPNSHYILNVCNNHCLLHSYKSRVYLM